MAASDNGTLLALGAAAFLASAALLVRSLGSSNEDAGVQHQEQTGHAVWIDILHDGERLPHFLERLGTYENAGMASDVAKLAAKRGGALGGGSGAFEVSVSVHDFAAGSDEDTVVAGFATGDQAVAFARRLHTEVA